MSAPLLDSTRINLGQAQILVVDDNANARKILADLLASFGARDVTLAEGGRRAQTLLAAKRFDLLVTDGAMPELDGYDLVRWLRALRDDEQRITPAIIVSAHTREDQIVRGRDCGAHYVIAKPVSPLILLERIFWIATQSRPFVITDTYAGPDRRWKQERLPVGVVHGRRRGDPRALMQGAEPILDLKGFS